MMSRIALVAVLGAVVAIPSQAAPTLRAGVCAIDISPRTFPIIISGGFLAKVVNEASGSLHARTLVLDDATNRIALTVVDSLMMPRELLDDVKLAASKTTGIPPERMLISATHTHSAPPVMGALGTDANPEYIELVRNQLVKVIECGAKDMRPARIGWSSVDVAGHTHCRRWILRPDKIRKDPFGELTVRAHMHPGYQNPEFIGPSGPVDPELTVMAVQSLDRKPIALLANYSMHYVGTAAGVSPDYYGPFTEKIRGLLGVADGDAGFVAMMSQGTSGDQHWMDYSRPKKDMNIEIYAEAIAQKAFEAYGRIEYRDWVPVDMRERTLTLGRRVGDDARLNWARQLLAAVPEEKPRNQVEVYAREQVLLAREPRRELKLQALRIGELGIAAFPNEVFAITGLKIKSQSPLAPTFNIELANGAEGYIPPPEQHRLGGYTTWPARTAGLEVEAEPKIVEGLLSLLEEVSGKPRRALDDGQVPLSRAVLDAKPVAYWRGSEFSGSKARDATGKNHGASYKGGVAFYLEGPPIAGSSINRAPHFAGGHMTATLPVLADEYTVAMWFYNNLAVDARAITGCLFSRGADRLCLSGTSGAPGKLHFASGDRLIEGRTALAPNTWNFVALTREATRVMVYLNGASSPEVEGTAPKVERTAEVLLGSSTAADSSLEGRIDEIAVFNRMLKPEEVARLYRAAGSPAAGLQAAR